MRKKTNLPGLILTKEQYTYHVKLFQTKPLHTYTLYLLYTRIKDKYKGI